MELSFRVKVKTANIYPYGKREKQGFVEIKALNQHRMTQELINQSTRQGKALRNISIVGRKSRKVGEIR